jgi:hypothetical protein
MSSPIINGYSRAEEHDAVFGLELIHGIVPSSVRSRRTPTRRADELDLADPILRRYYVLDVFPPHRWRSAWSSRAPYTVGKGSRHGEPCEIGFVLGVMRSRFFGTVPPGEGCNLAAIAA